MDPASFSDGLSESGVGHSSVVDAGNNSVIVGGEPTPKFSAVPGQPQTAPAGKYSDADLQRVRQQEKDKLYPTIEALKQQVDALTAERERERQEREAVAEKARQEAEEAARRKAEEETDVRSLLAQKEAELNARLEAERIEREKAFALLERERQFNELNAYRAERLAAEQDNIMPELLDMISGNTPEEIEASITGLKERTARILDSVQQATAAARQSMPGTRVTVPAAGPLDTASDQQSFTPEQIANMSYSEYVKNRPRLLGQASQNGSRGLFG